MQLKWNPSFTLNQPPRKNIYWSTSSSQGQYFVQMQNTNHASHNTTATTATTTSTISSSSDRGIAKGLQSDNHNAIVACCSKCGTSFCHFRNNSWRRVTGHYYLEAFQSTGREGLALTPVGDTQSPKNQEGYLQGCDLQPLACTRCDERFAFECLKASSDKSEFLNRLFFKLDKIRLLALPNNNPVYPEVIEEPNNFQQTPIDKQTSKQSVHIRAADSDSNQPMVQSALPDQKNMTAASESSEAVANADAEAAESIHNGAEWQTVHEVWTRKTHLTLSPASFGKRILDVKSTKPQTNGVKHHRPSQPSSKTLPPPPGRTSKAFVEYRPSIGATPLPSVNGISHHGRPPSGESSPSSRTDLDRIERLEGAVGHVQAEMHDLRIAIDHIRHDLRAGLGGSGHGRGGDDSATLEVLSETVSSTSAKVGEIDGIKIQLDGFKRRLNKVEDQSGVPTPQHDNFPRPSSTSQSRTNQSPYQHHTSVPSPHSRDHESRGWTAANSNKRKSVAVDGYSESMQPGLKKPRNDIPHYDSGRYDSSYSRPDNSLAPIQTVPNDSQESWRPTLPAIQGSTPIRPRSGRPRKSPPENIETPPWEKESWNNRQVDEDGYYRPLGGVPPISPGTHDHGRLIRRASGGGAGGAFQYMDHLAASKKTRQKPVRNSEGILIRKDGKPDQRSISSPMNLKKVHARKMAEAESIGGVHPWDDSNPESPVGPSPLGQSESNMRDDDEDRTASNSPAPEDEGQEGKHMNIMRRMFPNGIVEDSDRMHHAVQIFSNDRNPSDSRVKPRREMIKDEARSLSEEDREGSESRRVSNDSGGTSHTPYSNTAANEAHEETRKEDFPKPEKPMVEDSQPTKSEKPNEPAVATQTTSTMEDESVGEVGSKKDEPPQKAVESTAQSTKSTDFADSAKPAVGPAQEPGSLYQPSSGEIEA